jgi:hypothetical protein
MSKLYNFIYGLLLTWLYLRKLPVSYFENKRVVIVGPASSAFKTGKGAVIDSFDIIVRVNKSAGVVDTNKFKEDIGTRTDVLFHSFFENQESGGGPLDLTMFDRQGIKFLVNPRNNYKGFRNSLNFYKKYLQKRTIYTLDKSDYKVICAPLNGYRPTVGFTALSYLMNNANFRELYVTGFTFYRTPFGSGYRDHIQDPEKAKAFILEQGYHNIDLEFEAFKNLFNSTRKNILLDDTLAAIIKD